MAIRATLVAEDRDITLDGADSNTLALLEELRGRCVAGVLECREHDDSPRLAHRRGEDGRVHEAWLYVKRVADPQGGSYLLLCHHPQTDAELKSAECRMRVGMSETHRIEQDYLYRAGDHAGFVMDTEHAIPGARLDVYGEAGDTQFGFEVQLSALGAAVARKRDRAALAVDVPLVWTTNRADAPWAAKNPLAHIATNDIPGRRARLGSWRVASGLRTFELRRCTPVWFSRCPDTGGAHCRSGWHPAWEPLFVDERLTVDDVLVGVGEKRYARLDTGTKQGVALVPAQKQREWLDLYGPGRSAPGPREERESPEAGPRRECSYDRVDELPVPAPRTPPAEPRRPEPVERNARNQGESPPKLPAGTMTVADRLRRAGLSVERIAWWLSQERGAVRVDDEPVTEPNHPAAPPARVVLRG